jgi:Tfp pilus assembly protein PilZ
MDLSEQHLGAENPEKRQSARLDDYRPISVKDLNVGLIHKATMLNYSKTGMYFETDSFLKPGTEIYLGIENSSQVEFIDEFECKLAEITWRKKLKKSFYNFGYGVKFFDADKAVEPKCKNQREGVDHRKHPRKPFSNSVLHVADNQILKGLSKNISASGIFIESKTRLKVGQTVVLYINFQNRKRVKIKCRVIRTDHQGFGAKFLKKL